LVKVQNSNPVTRNKKYLFLALPLYEEAGIATGYMLEGSEFESWYGQEFTLLHIVWGPTSLLSNGYLGLFPLW
jgi:hypothetical protein